MRQPWPQILAAMLLAGGIANAQNGDLPPLADVTVKSSIDSAIGHCKLWAPESAKAEATPLFVYLHSWSAGYEQNNSAWFKEALRRQWIFLHPDFRGPNRRPEACGSELARQDILDAIAMVASEYKVDTDRVYLAGTSGGGHMAMLMAGYYPERFSAVSAWVGISDLAEWYRFHSRSGKPDRYAQNILACTGGPPGASPEVDQQYKARSPIFHLQQVGDLPLDLNAGVNDGHTGSVPISHTLRAFNVVAKAGEHDPISDAEIKQLVNDRKLAQPQAGDEAKDATYGRKILLRRSAGPARATIFAGGHEGLPFAACEWLAQQKRETKWKPAP